MSCRRSALGLVTTPHCVLCAGQFSGHPDDTVTQSLRALDPPFEVLSNVDYNEARPGEPTPAAGLVDLPDGGLVATDITDCAVKCAVHTPCCMQRMYCMSSGFLHVVVRYTLVERSRNVDRMDCSFVSLGTECAQIPFLVLWATGHDFIHFQVLEYASMQYGVLVWRLNVRGGWKELLAKGTGVWNLPVPSRFRAGERWTLPASGAADRRM